MKIASYFLLIIGLFSQFLVAQIYELPPTSTSYGRVPVISDEAMERCVKLYNEAKWLSEEIQNTYVDKYSQESVNEYNLKVGKHSEMIIFFNSNCAGKQSESAYRAQQKLNSQLQKYQGR